MQEYLRPWKLATLVIGLALLVLGAVYDQAIDDREKICSFSGPTLHFHDMGDGMNCPSVLFVQRDCLTAASRQRDHNRHPGNAAASNVCCATSLFAESRPT